MKLDGGRGAIIGRGRWEGAGGIAAKWSDLVCRLSCVWGCWVRVLTGGLLCVLVCVWRDRSGSGRRGEEATL